MTTSRKSPPPVAPGRREAEDSEPEPITVRTTEDLLAMVPLAIGFDPEDSVVMLTLAGPRNLHARIDLPTHPDVTDLVVVALLEPAVRYDVALVAFVMYTRDRFAAEILAESLAAAFECHGIEVLTLIRAADNRYHVLLSGCPEPVEGTPYDIDNHRFRAHGVLSGRVTHRSRADLAATLDPDPPAVAAVAAELATPEERVRKAGWVRKRVRRALEDTERLSDRDVAGLLRLVGDPAVRGRLWPLLVPETADRWVEFWIDVLRRTPDGLVAGPAAMVGFGAWVAGHGALAWCAIDRSLADDQDCVPALVLGEALHRAVDPSAWALVLADSEILDAGGS